MAGALTLYGDFMILLLLLSTRSGAAASDSVSYSHGGSQSSNIIPVLNCVLPRRSLFAARSLNLVINSSSQNSSLLLLLLLLLL